MVLVGGLEAFLYVAFWARLLGQAVADRPDEHVWD
jgi:hypothetical protein